MLRKPGPRDCNARRRERRETAETYGRTAVVTGAARGIGRAIALALAAQGADVALADLDPPVDVAAEIEALGIRALALQTDVSDVAQTEDLIKQTLAAFGKIEILVNNAGGPSPEGRIPFPETTVETWDRIISINLGGTRHCCRTVIGHMLARGYGKIVNLGSVTGIIGGPGAVDYSAVKAGIFGFTMALAKEVAGGGINVNCVSPGPIETRLIPPDVKQLRETLTGFNRIGQPEEIADTVVFLVSDEAAFITGQNFPVCGLCNIGGP